MSPLEGFLTVGLILTGSGVGGVVLVRRTRAATALCGRIIRETCGRPYLAARWDDDKQDWVNEGQHDVGPDQLRLLQDLDTHLKAYADHIADLYDTTTGDR
jgi:hypothetical protein